ncbi:hypothetical protein TRFO_20154 [Tritrichomonas foetus]|uniref:Uncharacterized protein n=1 Tax=Tritrichomonas foetus TaxID=1144522 RepID=A0A1J4KL32_9EUKA|nr:hypothetical protein TRFO_20154 [Tritrichomonas foetus]|eukprot:OHT10492.1 hypothetical protein TRFO_20154 [Tritrichomonas foetus]
MQDDVIFRPEQFFHTFEEGLKMPLDKIKSHYENLSNISNFNGFQIWLKNEKEFSNLIFQNMRTARQCLLLHLSQLPEADFFAAPPSDDVLGFALKEPDKPNSISEWTVLQRMINLLMENPDYFAELIHDYFETDLSYLTSFGWSTFPAFFSFFVTDQHCNEASYLIKKFMNFESNINKIILSNMLSSFFMCSFIFTSALWSKLYSNITQENTLTNLGFMKLLINCISSTSHLLSKNHKELIQIYFQKSPAECMNFLLNDFLAVSFDIYFKRNELSFQIKLQTQILHCFHNFGKDSPSLLRDKLISSFISTLNDSSNLGVPKMPTINELRKFPVIISYHDVVVLCEIINIKDTSSFFGCKTERIIQHKSKYLTKGYEPFSFDRILGVIPKDSVLETQPPSLFKRWFVFCSKIPEPINYLKKKEKEKSGDVELYKYVYLTEIRKYELDYLKLRNSLYIQTLMKSNQKLQNAMEPYIQSYLYLHCEALCKQYLKKKINKSLTFGKIPSDKIGASIHCAINEIYNKREINSIISFPLYCSILDLFEIEPDKIYLKLISAFKQIISLNKKMVFQKILPFRKWKKIIDNLCSRLEKSFSLPLGQQYHALLQFVSSLKLVDDMMKAEKMVISKFNLFFAYSVISLNNSNILDLYLLSKKITRKNREITHEWDEQIINITQILDAGMKSFLGTDKHTMACCFSYQFAPLNLVS